MPTSKFHTYVFGHAFTIESDHKPLKQINIKNLADTPVHLQRMLLQLQTYDVTIKYPPGKEMLVADVLFHYVPLKAPEIHLNMTIDHVHIPPNRKTEFQTLIQDDPLLCSLVGQTISMMSHMLYTHTMATETPSQLKMASSFEMKL